MSRLSYYGADTRSGQPQLLKPTRFMLSEEKWQAPTTEHSDAEGGRRRPESAVIHRTAGQARGALLASAYRQYMFQIGMLHMHRDR